MQTSWPKYLSEGLNLRLFHTGAYVAALYGAMAITVFMAGQLSGFIQNFFNTSTTNLRKAFTFAGFMLNGIALIISVHLDNPQSAMTVMALGTGVESVAWAGFAINHLDIAPRYASLLFGITNTMGSIPGILSPLLVGAITGKGTREEWTIIFYISAITFAFGAIFYCMFGSAERQPWAMADAEEEGENVEIEPLIQRK